jgi:hypothetical protein
LSEIAKVRRDAWRDILEFVKRHTRNITSEDRR